uniref:Leucine rich repeat (LRR) protein n=1 Tax=Methanococcus maripaludis (strain C6 / ATCC BAA-1332) TaxID=444158 RepID=A9A7D2_METM6
MTSVIIPDSVKIIEDGAFSYNKLTNLIIPDSVTTIGKGAFSYNKLSSVVIPDSVTTIGVLAFHNNELSDIVLPESLKSIENMAFSENQLKSVVIPKSVANIEDGAFTTLPRSSENSLKFEIKSMPYTYAEKYARVNCMPYTVITPLEELQIHESNRKNCEKYISEQFAEKTDDEIASEWYNLARNEKDYSKKYEYYKEVLIIYLEHLNVNPSDVDVLYNTGVVYYALQEYVKCRVILSKLLKINNTHEKALQLRLLCEQSIELFKVEHK